MTDPMISTDVNPSPVSTALRIGLFGGLIMIVVAMISNLTGFSIPTSLGGIIMALVVSLAVAVAVGVWAVREHRDKVMGGYIDFGTAFLVGGLALLIASLLNGAFNLIYINLIDPGYVETAVQKTAEMLENMGLNESQIEEQLAEVEKRMTMSGIIRQTLISSVVVSAIIGLVVAAIMKKSPPGHSRRIR